MIVIISEANQSAQVTARAGGVLTNREELNFKQFESSLWKPWLLLASAVGITLTQEKKVYFKMKWQILSLVIITIAFSGLSYSESAFEAKISKPEDGFAIGIPKHWNEKIYPSGRGTTYAYWDDFGNAITITVGDPNSFEKILRMIQNGEFTEEQINALQNRFEKDAPLKRNMKVEIDILSNQKALVQNFLYKHETAGHAFFIENKSYSFIKNNKQYEISFSPPPSETEAAAKRKFDESYRQIFFPILTTFFLK